MGNTMSSQKGHQADETPSTHQAHENVGLDSFHPAVEKALSNPLIGESIASFLPSDDLKSFREVNRVFHDAGTKVFRERVCTLELSLVENMDWPSFLIQDKDKSKYNSKPRLPKLEELKILVNSSEMPGFLETGVGLLTNLWGEAPNLKSLSLHQYAISVNADMAQPIEMLIQTLQKVDTTKITSLSLDCYVEAKDWSQLRDLGLRLKRLEIVKPEKERVIEYEVGEWDPDTEGTEEPETLAWENLFNFMDSLGDEVEVVIPTLEIWMLNHFDIQGFEVVV